MAYTWDMITCAISSRYLRQMTSTKFRYQSRYRICVVYTYNIRSICVEYTYNILRIISFGYCRYTTIILVYHAYTVTWLVPKFRRSHLSEICGGYRTSSHKTDIVNHIPDIILDILIIYLVYSFVQEYTKYITVLWQNIYKYIYIYMSGIFKTIVHFQVTGVWPQMVLRKDIKCAILSPHFCTWPPFSFCRLRLARTVVLSKNASHLNYFFVRNILVFLSIDVLCGTKMKCCFSTLGLTIFSYAAWFLYLDFPWFDLLLLSSTRILHAKLPCS